MLKFVNIIGLAILAFVVGMMLFGGDQGAHPIDRETAGARWTGEALDYVGLVLFVVGALWIVGITIKQFRVDETEGSRTNNIISFALALAGMALIWVN